MCRVPPGLYFRPQSQPLVSVISTISTRDLISTLDFNFQSKYKQFLFFEDVKKFDVNWFLVIPIMPKISKIRWRFVVFEMLLQ